MSDLSTQNVDVRKLARAYVALALAQDEAKRYVAKNPVQPNFLPLLTSLNITAELLEEVLQKALPEKNSSPSLTCSKMLM
jgi:hypothetical protein